MLAVTLFNPSVFTLISLPLCLGLVLGLFLFFEIGHRLGCQHRKLDPNASRDWVGVVDGPILALLGLLMAFSFSAAADRFEARKKMIVEETNAIGTAYLRLDLLAPADRDALRGMFRNYLDSRIRTYDLLPDIPAAKREFERSQDLQQEIWSLAVTSAQRAGTPAAMQLLPSLNAMFDIMMSRFAATQFHTPGVVLFMLIVLSLVAALLAGYQMSASQRRRWVHVILFVVIFTLAIYVIIDLDSPRMGFIRMDDTDALLRDLRSSIGR